MSKLKSVLTDNMATNVEAYMQSAITCFLGAIREHSVQDINCICRYVQNITGETADHT